MVSFAFIPLPFRTSRAKALGSAPIALGLRGANHALHGVRQGFQTRWRNGFAAGHTAAIHIIVQALERSVDRFDFPLAFGVKTIEDFIVLPCDRLFSPILVERISLAPAIAFHFMQALRKTFQALL
jgi:hypothetical protein